MNNMLLAPKQNGLSHNRIASCASTLNEIILNFIPFCPDVLP